MTKKELLEVIKNEPDDADICVPIQRRGEEVIVIVESLEIDKEEKAITLRGHI
jgi:hypothetical protein